MSSTKARPLALLFSLALPAVVACGAEGAGGNAPNGDGGGAGPVAAGSTAAPAGGSGGSLAGTAGTAGAAGTTAGAAAGSDGSSGAGGAAGAAGTAGAGPTQPPPASCGEAARAYTVAATMLDASLVPAAAAQSWTGPAPRTPVAIDAQTGEVYVGFARSDGTTRSVVIAAEGAPAAEAIVIADATIGGVAVTNDGVAALLFDPNESTDARMWTAVARFGADRAERFKTDLFRSPNLDDVDTKGGPSTGRLGYIAGTDTLIAYFGHTQRYDDGVRHQGGYLATVNASGEQDVISGWFGSHNLDQRLLIDGMRAAVLGMGDAFPKGIFFSYAEDARTRVILKLAADGVGAANGQLGGMVDLGDEIIVPFVTNRSISQDLDPGPWPNTDEAISMQIRDAAAAAKDLGLLAVPKSAVPEGDLPAIWLDAAVASGARFGALKSARYGAGELILLAWAESTGDRRNMTSTYYTMVVDRDGTVCQPKTQLEASFAFNAGDDLVARADGTIVWANVQGGRVQIVTLTP